MASERDLRLTDRIAIPLAELGWRFSRSSGPGGQGVNTTDSRVELVFPLASTPSLPEPLRSRALRRLAGRLTDGALVITACEHRSQWRNRQEAQRRLVSLLREAITPPAPPRRATRPSRGAVERRLSAKRRRSGIKERRRGRPGGDEE